MLVVAYYLHLNDTSLNRTRSQTFSTPNCCLSSINLVKILNYVKLEIYYFHCLSFILHNVVYLKTLQQKIFTYLMLSLVRQLKTGFEEDVDVHDKSANFFHKVFITSTLYFWQEPLLLDSIWLTLRTFQIAGTKYVYNWVSQCLSHLKL